MCPLPLSTDLDREDSVPYFLWDQPMTVAELRQRLRTDPPPARARLLAKILREAREADVWRFTTPGEIVEHWSALSLHLGRRRAFWEYPLGRWRADFRRRLVRRGEDTVIVDLVLDHTFQGDEKKQMHGRVRVDPPGEILANKLCALLSRAEIRDLVDLLALERAGHRTETALPLAARKDAGLAPGQLAWVLSQIQIGDDAEIPGEVSAGELRAFLADLQRRLTTLAFPAE